MGRSRTITGRKAARALGLISGPPLEAEEQAEVFAYLKTLDCYTHAGRRPAGDFAFAVPNGSVLAGDAGQRARQMRSMKAQGLKPAVSDIVIALPRQGFHGMFLEMKRVKYSRVDDAQIEWRDLMTAVGYFAVICRGFDEAKQAIDGYFA